MNFKPAARYPADPRVVFILALSVFSGLTSLAVDSAPQSLEAELPGWAVTLWGVILVAGSAITIFGIARNTFNGIIAEQIGSVMVAVATVFYSVVALMVVGLGAFSIIGVILAWGLACGWRWFQLQALIKNAYQEQVRAEVESKFLVDIESLR